MKDVLIYSGICLLQMLVYGIYLKEMIGFRRRYICLLIGWILLEVVDQQVIGWTDSSLIRAVAYLILLEIVAFYLCGGDWKKKLFLVFAFDVIVIIMETIIINLLIVLKVCQFSDFINNGYTQNLLLILTQLLTFLVCQIINRIFGKEIRYGTADRTWISVFLVSIGCFFANVILIMNIIRDNIYSYGYIFVMIILILTDFVSYYFYLISAKHNKADMEAKIYKEQLKMYEQWYEELKQSRTEIRSLKHDMKNHIGTLIQLSEQGLKEEQQGKSLIEIQRYLEQIDDTYKKISRDIDTGNMALDALVNMKKTYALSKQIILFADIVVPRDMKFDGLKLVIILGNLLDNAIEACENIEENKKKIIKLKIRYKHQNLYLQIENTYNGLLDGKSGSLMEGKQLETTKQNKLYHGIGIKNVGKVVEKYDGELNWSAEERIFKTEVLLFEFDKIN